MSDLRVRDADGVRWLVFDRPESRNGLTIATVDELTELLRAAAVDPAVRVVVLGGNHGAFCSGLDLKAAMVSGITDFGASMDRFHGLVLALRNLLKPTIAAVDGAAAGFGADLAMGCDLRLASKAAKFGERFVRIGLMPDGGGTFYLPRLVGLAKAYEMIYEGRMVEAGEAAELGLVNRVLDSEGEAFAAEVHAYAAKLATGAPLAQARAKAAILAGQGDFAAALAAERAGQLALLGSNDFFEGVQAFLTKREPQFSGR